MRIAPLMVLLVTMIPLSRAAALSDKQRTLISAHLALTADHQRWRHQISVIETLVSSSLGK